MGLNYRKKSIWYDGCSRIFTAEYKKLIKLIISLFCVNKAVCSDTINSFKKNKGQICIYEHQNKFYIHKKLTLDRSDMNSFHVKGQWELELNTMVEDNAWENTCSRCHVGVGSRLWKEFDWKMKMRFFRTPLAVSALKTNFTNKRCGMVSNRTLGLPKIQTFEN